MPLARESMQRTIVAAFTVPNLFTEDIWGRVHIFNAGEEIEIIESEKDNIVKARYKPGPAGRWLLVPDMHLKNTIFLLSSEHLL